MSLHVPPCIPAAPEQSIDLGLLAEPHLEALEKTRYVVDNTSCPDSSTPYEVMLKNGAGAGRSRFVAENGKLCPYFRETEYVDWVQIPYLPGGSKTVFYGFKSDGSTKEMNNWSDFIFLDHFINRHKYLMSEYNGITYAMTEYNDWDTLGTKTAGFSGYNYDTPSVYEHMISFGGIDVTSGTGTMYATNDNASGTNFGTGTCLRALLIWMAPLTGPDQNNIYWRTMSFVNCNGFTETVTAGPHTAGYTWNGAGAAGTPLTCYPKINGNTGAIPTYIYQSSGNMNDTTDAHYNKTYAESGHYNGKRYGRCYLADHSVMNYLCDSSNIGAFESFTESAPAASKAISINKVNTFTSTGLMGNYLAVDGLFVRRFVYPEPTAQPAGGW